MKRSIFQTIKLIFLFLLSFGIYLKTLSPHVFVGDSSELITAAKLLGVAHPTSYPLYVMAGKNFSNLPLGSPAYLLNFFSAVAAALSIVIILLILENVIVSQTLSLWGTLLFAFSLTFWSQAVIARVYSLNILLTCLLVYTITSPKNRLLPIFLLALGAANHFFIWLITPVLLLYFLKERQHIGIKHVVLFVFVFIVGISLYLELPLRATVNPPLNWHEPRNITNFLSNVKQSSYQHKLANRNAGDVLWLGYNLMLSFGPEFFYLGSFFMIFGIFYWFRRARWFLWGLLLTVLANFCLISLYGVAREFHLLYFLPTFLVTGWLLTAGLEEIIDVVPKNFRKLALVFPLFAVCLQLYFHYYPNNRRWHFLVYDLTANILKTLPEKAVLYIVGDSKTFTAAYQTMVENKRPDLLIGGTADCFPDAKVLEHQQKHGFRNQVFCTFFRYLTALGKDPSLQFAPTGLLWQQLQPNVTPSTLRDPQRYYRRREINQDYYLEQKSKFVLNYYNLNEAARLMANGREKQAIPYLIAAYQRSGRNEDTLFQTGRLFMKLGEATWAYKAFYKATVINPYYRASLQNLASMAQLLEKNNEAISYYQRLLRLDKNYYRAMYNLGNIYISQKNFSLARLQFEDFLAAAPPDEASLIANVKIVLQNLPTD